MDQLAARALDHLFRPRSVAIVGASPDTQKTAGRPIKYLRKHGFDGTLYPVNPRYEAIDGMACYSSIAALPEAPDVGIVLMAPERAEQAVAQLAARGTQAAIVIASGYAEMGPEGARRQEALKEAAGTMRLLGPNTIGIVNVTDGIMLSATSALEADDMQKGGISLVSQSGGILGSLFSRAAGRGIGLAKLVTTGNEVDLDVSDFIDYLVEDAATNVIALYLEGLRHPDKFRAAAIKANAAGKPIVVFKVGRSEAGMRSATSHTGALAGADRLYDALFEQIGTIRLDRFSDLLDVPLALASRRQAAGRRVAILTSTGGAGTLLADCCGLAGFETPIPDEATAARLSRLITGAGSGPTHNPIDLTLAGLEPEIVQGAITALLESPSYDAVIVIVGSSGLAKPDLVARPVVESLPKTRKPLLVYVSPNAPHIVNYLSRQGVPAFDSPEGCVAALSALARNARYRPRVETRRRRADPPFGDKSGVLNEAESKQLFAHYGIPSVREVIAETKERTVSMSHEFSGPLVLKILTREIAHKSDIGGVLTHIRPAEIAERCDELSAAAARAGIVPEGYLLQEQIMTGVEMILGFVRDPQLGPAILLGAGGISAEIFGDTTIRLLPVDREDAEAMIDGLKTNALLGGFRGKEPSDSEALIAAITAFSDMVMDLGECLLEAEINPLFVLPEGQGVKAADGLVVLR